MAKERGRTARTVVLTSVAVAGLVTALATPASNILWALLWLTLLCASAPQTFAQGGTPLWTNRYNGPENDTDSAYATAVGSSPAAWIPGPWSNGTEPVLDDTTNNVVTQPIGTSRFFRLNPR